MQIYGIHPADKDLNFLKRVNHELKNKYPDSFKYLRLDANYPSHNDCISALKNAEFSLVLFFCHALNKSIRGCKIEHSASSLSHKDFNYGTLISPTNNIDIFKNKNVFCLACNSKDLGNDAINAGANVFLGFGDIPFYTRENFKEARIETMVKQELSSIILKSLFTAIDNNYTFNQLSIFLQTLFSKRIYDLKADKNSGINIRKEVAIVLSKIKNGITMFGKGNLNIIN